MANFDVQITDLVGGTIDSAACNQWAADACREIIHQLPAKLKDFPHAVYLGGWIVQPKIKDINKPVNKNKFIRGINKIDYNKFRILETRAYFIPNKEEAKRMLDIINKAPKLKNLDIFFSNNEMIKYFYYPAVSLQTTGLKSTIDEKNVYGRKSDPKQFY